MLMNIKEILFFILYLITVLIVSFKVNSKIYNENQDKEKGYMGVVITIIPLVVIGVISYNLLFN